MTASNGYKGNALSDQPPEVQKAYNAQLMAMQAPGAKAIAPLGAGMPADKFIDPALIAAFGGLLGQVIGAFVPAQKGAPAGEQKFIDPALIAAFGGLIGQVIGAFVPHKSYAPAAVAGPAAPMQKGAQFNRDYVLQNGHFETFPTWSFWGETTIRLDNTGSVPTTALVNDARFFLNPGEGTTTSGKWAAFPVRVTNSSEHPSAQLTVRVW